MEYNLCLLLLSAALSLCSGQGDPADSPAVEARILGSTRMIKKPGGSMELTCQLNQGLPVILTHTIQWVHVSLANHSKPNETILTTQQTLTDAAYPADYGIGVKYNNDVCNFTLMVKNVKPTSDGIFTCRVFKTSHPHDLLQKEDVHVIVVNDVDLVALKFDGEERITGEANTRLQREEGRYGVTCFAHGFNPDASISIFLGDEHQESGGTEIMLDDQRSVQAKARRYKASATAAKVDLTAAHSGQTLKCVARAGFDGAVDVVASVPLTVIALEPEITCNKNASAKPSEKYVKIHCTVKHDKVKVSGYSFEIGHTGEIIRPQETSKNYHQVDVVKIDDDTTEVILDLFQVDEDHFNTFYYLDVYTKSGQKFRAKASLIRLEPDYPSSSSTTTATFFFCLLSVILSLCSVW